MFTGIVTDVGEITALTPGGQKGDRRFVIRTKHDMGPVAMGASIACSGCCLTVIEKGSDWFAVEASGETLDKTHLGDWRQGQRINLELSLKLGDELGGHLVYGHVDGVGRIVSMTPEDGSAHHVFGAPAERARFVDDQVAIAVDEHLVEVKEPEGKLYRVNIQ